MSVRAQVFLIVFACLATFYPAFSAEVCSVDDTLLVKTMKAGHIASPIGIFTQAGASTLYYRPILGITFWIDQTFLQINPFWMHLENVLYHLISMLLLFFIGRLVFAETKQPYKYLPLFTALLWGLHPLTTESVNWISGRTDLLAGIFVFGATLSILHFRRSHNIVFLLLAALASLLAMLSKEVAVAFFPGAILILFALASTTQSVSKTFNSKFIVFLTTVIAAIPLLFFFLIRTVGTVSTSSRIGVTFQYMENNPVHSLMLFSRAIGFYLSKIFFPWPLNLAIVDVDPLYDLLAIPIVLLCIWLVWNRSLLAAFFLTGIILLTPSFLIALNQIAWTPFAERYVYISMAFILLAIIGSIAQYPVPQLKKIYPVLMTALVFIISASSFQRSSVWQSNLGILEDTALKSPYCKKIQWLYGGVLSNNGQYEKALEVTKRAVRIASSPMSKDYSAELNLGNIYINLNQLDNALITFNKIIKRSDYKSSRAVQGLLETYSLQARNANNPEKSKSSYKEAEKSATLLYNLKKDPFIWYNLGKLSIELKETERAREYFTMAHNAFQDESPYKVYAKKLSLK